MRPRRMGARLGALVLVVAAGGAGCGRTVKPASPDLAVPPDVARMKQAA